METLSAEPLMLWAQPFFPPVLCGLPGAGEEVGLMISMERIVLPSHPGAQSLE